MSPTSTSDPVVCFVSTPHIGPFQINNTPLAAEEQPKAALIGRLYNLRDALMDKRVPASRGAFVTNHGDQDNPKPCFCALGVAMLLLGYKVRMGKHGSMWFTTAEGEEVDKWTAIRSAFGTTLNAVFIGNDRNHADPHTAAAQVIDGIIYALENYTADFKMETL